MSDWDIAVYFQAHFDPQTLRDIGWPGEVFEVGGWSDGVFNGGAWLEIDGRRVDVHYRDLGVIDREIAGTHEGRFSIEPLMFHLAGIPTYRVLAERTLDYARVNHAPYGRLAQSAGLVAQASSQAAHAVLAARGEWVTNEKTLLTRAGLREVDEFIAAARPDPDLIGHLIDASRALCSDAVREATVTVGPG